MPLRLPKKPPKRWGEKALTLVVAAISWSMLIVLVGVIGFLAYQGGKVLSWTFLTTPMREGMQAGGIAPPLVGSLWVSTLALLIGAILGTATGAYLSEFSPKGRLHRLIELLVNTLAGVPSIVYGLFGLALFVVALGLGASILSGALTLSLLSLPILIRNAQEAFAGVSADLKLTSLGMGASPAQTFWRITLRLAFPRLITGYVLAMGRLLGETAPILFTVAAYYLPTYPRSPFEPTMMLPYHLYALITSGTNITQTYPMAFGTALVLVSLTLILTIAAAILRFRLKKRLHV
jgi:phosphate transport system permease protein